ncbi:GatB/YqeY domain-containing protein [Clostridium sp.]|uniref:GatB/YqeY domain-containing protein n=1 Tax=Clostridium sp. TaxID=1506 RepID=UPI001A48F823|nr:GatB/YqeY domain-containing protein [Clostridium sp.]
MLKYLPQQLTKSEILELVREIVVKLGTNSMKRWGKFCLSHCLKLWADQWVNSLVKNIIINKRLSFCWVFFDFKKL